MTLFKKKGLIFFVFIFLCFIFLIFSYQLRVQDAKNSYHNLKESIIRISFLNSSFDKIAQDSYNVLNFDIITDNIQTFLQEIDKAKKIADNGVFSDEVLVGLDDVESAFKDKYLNIERLKSRQVTNLSSIYFLFDNASFIKDEVEHYRLPFFINNSIFQITKSLLNLYKEFSDLKYNIQEIKRINSNIKNEYVDLFLLHVELILNNETDIVKFAEKIQNNNIEEKIDALNNLLYTQFNDLYAKRNIIVAVCFICLLFMIFFIYTEHEKIRSTTKELQLFRQAINNTHNHVFVTDAKRNIIYANERFLNFLGYTEDELIGQTPSKFKSGKISSQTYKTLNETINKGEIWQGEISNKKKNGEIVYEQATIIPILEKDVIKSFITLRLDITNHKQKKQQAKMSNFIFEHMQDGIVLLDENKNMINLNQAYIDMIEYSKEELLGNPSLLLDTPYIQKIDESIEKNGTFSGVIVQKTKSGRQTKLLTNISTLKNKKGKIKNYIISHSDLNELFDIQSKIEYLIDYDPTTTLYNRNKLELSLIEKIQKKSNEPFYILMMDLNRFKLINDSLGHNVGDEALRAIVSKVKTLLNKDDYMARFGGDEFIIVCDRSKEEVDRFALEIINILHEPIKVKKYPISIDCCIGIASYPQDGKTYSELLKSSDIALNQAKKSGNNSYEYYTPSFSVNLKEKFDIQQALLIAIEKEEFYLNYQPQYDLKTRKITAFEALLRWNSKILGFVPPDKFISILEETKNIIIVGKMIFEMACRDFAALKKINPNLKYIAINISSVQFSDIYFIEDICKIIEKYGLTPHEIELEITERYVINFSKNNIDIFIKLRNLGFRFSVDDFGTGYSSLNYLSKFPLDVIKIDKSFVDEIFGNENYKQISAAIVSMAKIMNCKVVAEGIEEQNQEDILGDIGCDYGQGYFFSRPLKYEDALGLIEDEMKK